MIRREFLMTAGVTVAAISVFGPAIWTEARAQAADAPGASGLHPAGWMRGHAGGCACAVGPEPVLPVWATA